MTGKKKKKQTKKKPAAKKRRAEFSKARIEKPVFEDDTPIIVVDENLAAASTAESAPEIGGPKKKAAKARKKKAVATGTQTSNRSTSAAAATAVSDVPTPSAEPAPADTSARLRSATSLMPESGETRAVLDERAAALAKEMIEEQDERRHADQICFRLGTSARYGIPYSNLDEVMYASRIAPVPCTPAFVAGVINRKGHLLTVLDLRTFFGLKKDDDLSDARIIVVHHAGVQVGLLVSAVEDSGRYDPDRLAPPLPSASDIDGDYVAGIWDGSIAMLDVGALLSDAALTIDESVL